MASRVQFLAADQNSVNKPRYAWNKFLKIDYLAIKSDIFLFRTNSCRVKCLVLLNDYNHSLITCFLKEWFRKQIHFILRILLKDRFYHIKYFFLKIWTNSCRVNYNFLYYSVVPKNIRFFVSKWFRENYFNCDICGKSYLHKGVFFEYFWY